MNKFEVSIKFFDRDALEWAARFSELEMFFEDLREEQVASDMKKIKDIFIKNLTEQSGTERFNQITELKE